MKPCMCLCCIVLAATVVVEIIGTTTLLALLELKVGRPSSDRILCLHSFLFEIGEMDPFEEEVAPCLCQPLALAFYPQVLHRSDASHLGLLATRIANRFFEGLQSACTPRVMSFSCKVHPYEVLLYGTVADTCIGIDTIRVQPCKLLLHMAPFLVTQPPSIYNLCEAALQGREGQRTEKRKAKEKEENSEGRVDRKSEGGKIEKGGNSDMQSGGEEKIRKTLAEKIAQLNSDLDDISAQYH
ncbi:hypothetical protein Acr_04g0010500 [Actinidia rufa]|uniref:Uncharacterized protein n=1 Tax=Actinidia rufa TaxID=165716 RepID=A0A7J0EJ54_9ERIC|nr:hypothetical protein Acr_04g0010500 [Actinidia rufa]